MTKEIYSTIEGKQVGVGLGLVVRYQPDIQKGIQESCVILTLLGQRLLINIGYFHQGSSTSLANVMIISISLCFHFSMLNKA